MTMIDKDSWLAEHMFPKNTDIAIRKPRTNVKLVDVFTATRKTTFTLCILGSWAIYMPPYNIARLSSLMREAGYLTKVHDFNIESHYALKEANPDLADAWNGANYWWWQADEYYQRIHPTYEPILKEYLEKLIEEDSDVVGFSTYYTNFLPTLWMIKELRKRKPNVTIIMGGPECHEKNFDKPEEVDYYFIGESEQNILDFFENWEKGVKPIDAAIGGLYSDTRIDIDSLPYPDYSDFDLTKYWGKNSICAEISRGCIAKCSYCTEVYYWKFRDRGAQTVVDELEYQVKKYGISFVSFVDSLMNGNLKEFRSFCQELVDRKLGFNWWGYARADGRMDLEFYKLMKEAGCQGFNYGIESGSDTVLKLINKKNTVAEINQNIIDSDKVGMKVSACWVIGAPGEDIEAFSHSFNMLWNHRARILAVSPGPGLGDNLGSDYDNREKYNLNPRDRQILGGWYTLDFKNTRLHRMVRIKLMHIWLHLCKKYGGTLSNVHSVGNITDHFKLDFQNEELIEDEVLYENYDYNIINSGLGDFADSLMNEVFGFLRMLWRVKGGYEITIDFNDELDHKDFIFVIEPSKYSYSSKIRFRIDDDGNYDVLNTYKYNNFDKSIIDNDGFEYVYESSGKWIAGDKTKTRKIFYMESVARPVSLPLESCFSSMGVSERQLLHEVARNLKTNGVVVDIGFNPGGRSAIIANANKTLNILLADPYQPNELAAWKYSLNEPWISDQLIDAGRKLGLTDNESTTILGSLKETFNQDPSGQLARKEMIKKYPNISIIYSYTNPEHFKWPETINMLLISDADKERLRKNLEFFSKILAQGGKLLIHLYGIHDSIVEVVDEFIATGWKITRQVETLIVIERHS